MNRLALGIPGASVPDAPAPQQAGTEAYLWRRLAAGAVDSLILAGALVLIMSAGLAVATDELVTWVALGWTLVFSPLYFALYHAYGTGATPGQLELRIGVRDSSTGERPGLGRCVARAYLGFGFLVLVLPALVDLDRARYGRSLRDRITRTTVLGIVLTGKAPELAGPTVPELVGVFEPTPGTRRYLRRGWTLLTARPRLIVGTVAAVYAVLVAISAILAFLIVADSPDVWTVVLYAGLVLALLVSGVYWVQAAVVTAVEGIRVGKSDASVPSTLGRASRRANALTAALFLLLLAAAVVAYGVYFALPLLARLTLVAPALVLEDTRVLGAFRRSWQLTCGQSFRLFGLLLLSGAMLLVPVSTSVGIVAAAAGSTVAVLAGLAVGAVVFVVVLAWLGATWSLVYHDARRALPPGADR